MAILTRLNRLFRADVHAVLDQLEEPDALLRQAIRDMEEELDRGSTRLRAQEQELATSQRRQREIEAGLAGITGELDLCFAAGNEALARLLLRRRLEGERLLKQVAQQLQRLSAAITEAAQRIADQRQRLDGLRQRAALFDAASPGVEAPNWSSEDFAVSEADVELALLREKQRRAS